MTDGEADKPYHRRHAGGRRHRGKTENRQRVRIGPAAVHGHISDGPDGYRDCPGPGSAGHMFPGSPCPVPGVWRGISLSDSPSVLDIDGMRPFGGLAGAAEAAGSAASLGRGNQRVPDSSHRACPECKSAFQ